MCRLNGSGGEVHDGWPLQVSSGVLWCSLVRQERTAWCLFRAIAPTSTAVAMPTNRPTDWWWTNMTSDEIGLGQRWAKQTAVTRSNSLRTAR